MLNCPLVFHSSYYIECFSFDNLKLVKATPDNEMPDAIPDVTHYLNAGGFAGPGNPIVNAFNNHELRFPRSPLTTHYDKNDQTDFCDVTSLCTDPTGCKCTTVLDIEYNVTVRLVVSTVGAEKRFSHPIHIHGHSVHILKVGFGQYSSETGALVASSPDITCAKDGNDEGSLDEMRCLHPRLRSSNQTFPLDKFTVRKDTFTVPAGGYVILQFRSDNPGYWLFHCHVQLHQRDGMAFVIKEAVEKVRAPPQEMKFCNSFLWEVEEYMAAIAGDSSGGGHLSIPITSMIVLIVLGTLHL